MIEMKMNFRVFLILFLCHLRSISSQEPAIITVKGMTKIAETDQNFICATLDWWPSEKCNYNSCPWGQSSVLNLDLHHPFLYNAVQAFNPLRIRIGGSLQDKVLYDTGDLGSKCHPFIKIPNILFGFSKGYLKMSRWDELIEFFRKTGSIVTFGLNALYGRKIIKENLWGGPWNSTNAYNLIQYTIFKGYNVDSWEFGNELSGSGIGARVDAEQYGKDLVNLKTMLNAFYKDSPLQPLLLAPGGFYDKQWYTNLLQSSGPSTIDVMTHHIYNLGAGVDPHLMNKILDPHYLNQIERTFQDLQLTLQKNGSWASAWVGESGGAYNSGGHLVSETFVNSFWYLDQLGMSSKYNTKVYCRQSLIGGYYGLLNQTTFIPNPDYYSALLWHRLMGQVVLDVDFNGSHFLRPYAHCSKGKVGVTLLLINLSNTTNFKIQVQNDMIINLSREKTFQNKVSFFHKLKTAFSWLGSKTSDDVLIPREEYHLTPKDGRLQSQIMLLNGSPLEINEYGEIPELNPILIHPHMPISIAPSSIAFVTLPNFDIPACS